MTTTIGALLIIFGGIAFTVALIAGLYSVFGVWAGVGAASLIAVAIGRKLIESSGGDQ